MNKGGVPRSPVKTAETSFAILEQLMEAGPASLSGLADSIGLAKSTIHRHLQTLETHGYVAREDDQFRIGLRFLEYGIFARNQLPFYSICADKVDQLAEETGEKTRLATEENGLCVVLYRSMGKHPIQATSHIGSRQRLHQIAGGKAMLASMPDEKVEAIIDRHGLPPRTDQTITEKEALFEELERVRERGYAFNLSESIPNLNAIGAAVHDSEGRPIGALSISGTAHRITGSYAEETLPNTLLGAIGEIELNLNYR